MILRMGFIVSSVLGLMTICVGLLMDFVRFRFLGLEYLMYPGGILCWFIWGDSTHPSWAVWIAIALSTGFNMAIGFILGALIGGARKIVLVVSQRE
jgi:hypothetical protein